MTDREVLFRTVHGSRLYGLAHADSDWDWYTVVAKKPGGDPYVTSPRYSTQQIVDGQDSNVKDLGTWLMECQNGVPQALEAMFSTQAEVDHITALRSGYRVGTGVWAYYRRTMRNFALSEDFKRRRHALRLALNARDFRLHGRFDPTMTETQADWATVVARNYDSDRLLETVDTIAFD